MSLLSSRVIRALALGSALLLSAWTSPAQLLPASPPVANPSDTRFQSVQEDWTSPALTSSHLIPVRPIAGFVDEELLYTVELVRLQWRWGDPVDLYIMKPKRVKKPPLILYLYGYPTDTDIFRNAAHEELVTRDGFAAIGFVSALTGHRYHDRPMKQWFLSLIHIYSILGSGAYGGTASDGLDGLGYNAVNASGACPANGLGQASGAYQGSPIKSGYPGSTATANVLAFNIKGKDPISGTTIPAFTVVEVGAAPLVFITERNEGQLTNLTNASPVQLQQVLSLIHI